MALIAISVSKDRTDRAENGVHGMLFGIASPMVVLSLVPERRLRWDSARHQIKAASATNSTSRRAIPTMSVIP